VRRQRVPLPRREGHLVPREDRPMNARPISSRSRLGLLGAGVALSVAACSGTRLAAGGGAPASTSGSASDDVFDVAYPRRAWHPSDPSPCAPCAPAPAAPSCAAPAWTPRPCAPPCAPPPCAPPP